MQRLAFIVGAGVFLLDLVTKWFVKGTLALHYYPIVNGFLTLQYVRNEGIAFGMLQELQNNWKPLVLSAIAVAAIAIICYYILTLPRSDRLTFLALGLLLGGIAGNFLDRALHGYVVDFVTIHIYDWFAWPTFNVADSAITCGVMLILLRTFVFDRHSPSRERQSTGFLLLPLFLASPGAIGTEQIVRQLQEQYDGIQSFEADFQQTFRSRGIEQIESGIVMMKRPGKMYWEYRNPQLKIFVADGKKTYFYVPADKQVIVSDLDLETSDSPLLFLLGRGNIERDFLVSLESEEYSAAPDVFLLRLTPKRPQPDFSYLLAEVAKEELWIRRLTVVEPIGQENEYLLTNVRQNLEIPDKKFQFKIPSNAEVIEQ